MTPRHGLRDVSKHRRNPVTALPARKQAVIYVRVSSREQDLEGYSLDAQLKLLREYAAVHSIEVVQEFRDVETAKRTGREEFGQMLKFLHRSRRCQTVLTEKTDRIYRNLKDWVSIDDLDLELHLVKENVILSHDSRSSEKFMHGIRVLMAKNYIDNLSEEVSKGLREKAAQGMWPSYAPLGYRNVAVSGEPESRKKMIEPDPERAPLVIQLFKWYATGDYSLKEIGRMAREGLGLTFRKSGAPIPTSTVHKILRNRIYTGQFNWNGRLHRGSYKALISHELWERVQDVLDGRQAQRPKRRVHRFTFSGLIRCGHCGCSMVGEIHKGKYIYYRCTGHKGRCGEPYTRQEVLEQQFADLLAELRFEPHALEWITSALRESHRDEKRFHEQAIARFQAEYTALQNRIDGMYVDKLDGRISAAFFDRKAAEWRAEQDRIQSALAGHQQANRSYLDSGVRLLELASRASEMFKAQPPEARQELLKFVVSNSTWRGGQLSISYRQPFDLILKCAGETRKLARAPDDNRTIEGHFEKWSGSRDSNPGPLGPQPSALPGCATPRSSAYPTSLLSQARTRGPNRRSTRPGARR
jgi:site-specific DNA recombinase